MTGSLTAAVTPSGVQGNHEVSYRIRLEASEASVDDLPALAGCYEVRAAGVGPIMAVRLFCGSEQEKGSLRPLSPGLVDAVRFPRWRPLRRWFHPVCSVSPKR